MKNRLSYWLFALTVAFLPMLALAGSTGTSLTLTPPVTDVSVALLGKVFGSMPPVLYPSEAGGMIPKMFSIFNMAVLTLGGIVLMYTLIVSTVNTAHEGEVLGKRWASIWIPVRQVTAFALLIPMKSGYCLMQCFIMWVVLQGIGAADMLWSTSLNYLRSGGYIIAAPLSTANFNSIYAHDQAMMKDVAAKMLDQLVCMEGLRVGLTSLNGHVEAERQGANQALANEQARYNADLNKIRDVIDGIDDLADKTKVKNALIARLDYRYGTPIGIVIIDNILNGYDQDAQKLFDLIVANPFTNNPFPKPVSQTLIDQADAANNAPPLPNPIPDFISTATFSGGSTGTEQVLPQEPAAGTSDPLLSLFSGTCGYIKWAAMTASDPILQVGGGNSAGGVVPGINLSPTSGALAANTAAKAADLAALMTSSRKSALLAMYNDLSITARTIVANFATGIDGGTPSSLGQWGATPPMAAGNSPLPGGPSSFNPKAYRPWEASSGMAGAPLLAGTELYNAVQTYNAIMTPALSAILNISKNFDWIENSKSKGWISAGSYFIDMAKLNEDQNKVLRDSSAIDVKWPTTINVVSTPPNMITVNKYASTGVVSTQDASASLLKAWGLMADDNSAIPAGVTRFSNIAWYRGVDSGTPPAIVKTSIDDYNKVYLLQAPDYVPPNVLGDALNPQLPFVFNFSKLDDITEVSCWGTFCLGSALQNAFIKFVNKMLLPAIRQFVFKLEDEILKPLTIFATQVINTMILGAISSGMHPILALAQAGNSFLLQAGLIFIAVTALNLIAGLLAGVAIPFMMMLNPFFLLIIGVLMTYGFLFAFWAPMVPFLIFFMASLGWFAAVIEAIVAAPLVALGLAHPEGDPILGKADPAVCMITNVFLRPTFLLLGFVFGFILTYIGVLLFNQGFSYITGSLMGQLSGFGSFAAPFVLCGIYIYVFLEIVSKSFEMIHSLPDRALVWINCQQGGAPGQFTETGKGMRDQVQSSASGAQGMVGFDSARGAGKGIHDGAVSAAKAAAGGGGEGGEGGGSTSGSGGGGGGSGTGADVGESTPTGGSGSSVGASGKGAGAGAGAGASTQRSGNKSSSTNTSNNSTTKDGGVDPTGGTGGVT